MPPRRGAPTLGTKARKLRISKGYSQRDAGEELIDRSQAYISQLESDMRHPREIRDYIAALESASPKSRTAGGILKAGRAIRHSPDLTEPAVFRGEPLDPDFDHAGTLPQDIWIILGIARTSPSTELAFLESANGERSGLVGFHLLKGEIKRGRIIPITEEYDEATNIAMEAFAHGAIDVDDDDTIDDAELLEDEE